MMGAPGLETSRGSAGLASWVSPRRLLWTLVGAIPAIVATVWWIDWRHRLGRSTVPEESVAGFVCAEAYEVVQEASALTLSTGEHPLADRIHCAGRMATLLALADQLDDVQTAVDLCRPRLEAIVDRSSALDGRASSLQATAGGSMWVYTNLRAGRGREAFLPPSSDEARAYLHWAKLRQNGPQANAPPEAVPESGRPFGPDTTLTPMQALAALTIWEAALSSHVGRDPSKPLKLLSSVQAPFGGTFVFDDKRTSSESDWVLRALRYPDVSLPADLARVLRDALLPYADVVWLSLVPGHENESSPSPPETTDLELMPTASITEAYLRWCLARLHADALDTEWFERHQQALGTGAGFFHRWSRSLAREVANLTIPGPADADIERVFADRKALELIDALALTERRGPLEARRRFPGDGHDVRALLEPYVAEFEGASQTYLPVARAIAMAFATNDYVVGQWRDLAPLLGEGEIPGHERWMFLCRARITAAQALGRLAALADKPAEDVGAVSSELCLWDPQPWNPDPQDSPTLVRLAQYVPGLQSLHAVIILTTQGEKPRVYTAS